jgi:ectoine hydroxylase
MPHSGLLSRDELAEYDDRGYLVLRGVFDRDEVAVLRNAATEIVRKEADASGMVVTESSTVVTEPGTKIFKSKFAVHKSDKIFGRLARDARLVERAKQLLDDDVYIHQSRLNFQPAFFGTGFQPHSDYETWASEDGMPLPRAFSAVIMLERNMPQNGALMVVPGSHKQFIACPGATPDANWEQSLLYQKVGSPRPPQIEKVVRACGNDIVYCSGEPGDVVLFDCNLLHLSHNNISPWSRVNGFFVYNAVSNRLGPPLHAPKPRPEHVATRDPEWTQPIRPESGRIVG